MDQPVGHTRWAIAEGHIPPAGTSPGPERAPALPSTVAHAEPG